MCPNLYSRPTMGFDVNEYVENITIILPEIHHSNSDLLYSALNELIVFLIISHTKSINLQNQERKKVEK